MVYRHIWRQKLISPVLLLFVLYFFCTRNHLHLLVHFTLSLEVLFIDEMAGDLFYSRPGIIVLLLVHLPKTALCERAGGVRHLGCDNCRIKMWSPFVSVCLSHKFLSNIKRFIPSPNSCHLRLKQLAGRADEFICVLTHKHSWRGSVTPDWQSLLHCTRRRSSTAW